MSDMRDNFSNPLPILALLLVAAGLIAQTVPLSSIRPQDSERLKPPPSIAVPSRLWQDPLAAVEAHQEANKAKPGEGAPPPPDLATLRHEVAQKLGLRDHKGEIIEGARATGHLLVLPVMLSASPFPDDAEIRRRIRYAVESALVAQGFAPENAEAINFVHGPRGDPSCSSPAGTDASSLLGGNCRTISTIPYEWFQRTSAADGTELPADASTVALVLWMREHELATKPIEGLEDLVRTITPDQAPPPQVSVIGPATSSQYLAIMREVDDRNRKRIPPSGQSIQFLSYGATISDDEAAFAALGRHEGNPRPPEEIVRVIKGDDLLIKALVRELGRRGVDRTAFTGPGTAKAPCRDAIALVVEADYEYGRSLGRAFVRHAAERCDQLDVRVFTYFRGLDGVLPVTGEREERRAPRSNDAKGKEARTPDTPLENAEGRNQFDYLRRIGDQIAQLDAEGGSERHLRAVGIFGSDVYDKLLVLQALQPRLPSTVFFTTDLDARFLHRDQASWARNLVVASHFGLALHGKLQGGTAPFRDGYQTAAYLATLAASHPEAGAAARRVAKVESPPRLFEIGRTRPVDLGASSDAAACPELLRCESFHPAPALEIPRFASWRVWLAIGLGLLLVLLTTRANRFVADVVHIADQPPEARRRIVRGVVAWSLGVAAVALTMALVAVFVTEEIQVGEGEPFVWLEGVSAWPSHLLRFFALLVAVVLGAVAMRRLRIQAANIAAEFDLPLQSASWRAPIEWVARPGVPGASDPPRRWRRRIEWLRGPFVDFAQTERETAGGADRRVVVDRLWLRYLARTSGAPFWSWIALATVLLGAFAFALYALDPPFFAHRGVWVMHVNELLWVGNVVVLWGTIFWTVFEARACAYFIDRLSSTPSAWPAATLARESERTGVPRACLVAQLDFRLILRAAERIGPLVYMPFVQIFLLGVAFHPFLDESDVPWTLISLAAISLAYAIYAMIRLRGSAERARKAILAHYNEMLLWLQGSGTGAEPEGYAKEGAPGQRPTYAPLRLEEIDSARRPAASGQVKALVADIGAAREGPFVPLLQQPAVKALLIPFGGWSGLSLVEPALTYFGL